MDTDLTLEHLRSQAKDVAAQIDDPELLNKFAHEVAGPFNKKIRELRDAERKAKQEERERAAKLLCEALQTGEKVVMREHGFLDIFSSRPGSGDYFYSAEATVHVYQPRKKLLWLNVTGTKGPKREKFEQCRAFTLHDVARYNVSRKVA